MKRFLFCVLFSALLLPAFAGDTLSLHRCWEMGQTAYPVSANAALLAETSLLKIQALTTNYFPRLSLTAQASYQSEVTALDLSSLSFPVATPSKDQYKIALDVQQTIYDAGLTRHSKKMERLGAQEAVLLNRADWHTVKQQIQQVYFAGLLYQSQKQIVTLLLETLTENMAVLRSAVNNGMRTPRDLYLLEVEKLKAEQQLTEANNSFNACLKMLEQLTDDIIYEETVLAVPVVIDRPEEAVVNRRPEMAAFDARKTRLLAAKDVLTAELLPRVNLFGQAGYGRPGLNMLSTTFDPYYVIGLRLSWTPWDWGNTRKNKKIQEVQAKIAGNQQAAFDENVRTQAWNSRYDIYKQKELLRQDMQIVLLREKITKESASQLTNGTVTTSDYISDLNAEMTAHINQEIHAIRLVKSQIEYYLLLGWE